MENRAGTIPTPRGPPGRIWSARAGRWIDRYVNSPVVRHFDEPSQWSCEWRRRLYTEQALEALAGASALDVVSAVQARAELQGDPELHLFTDLQLRLPAGFLVKVDIASNMASLEVRSPFLDHELVEFAATLPVDLKLLGGQKGLLRRLAAKHLPAELIRAPKRGFAPRLEGWLLGAWSRTLHDAVGDSALVRAGLLRGDVLQSAVDELEAGHQHGQRLWSFLCLETWWRIFIDRSIQPSPLA